MASEIELLEQIRSDLDRVLTALDADGTEDLPTAKTKLKSIPALIKEVITKIDSVGSSIGDVAGNAAKLVGPALEQAVPGPVKFLKSLTNLGGEFATTAEYVARAVPHLARTKTGGSKATVRDFFAGCARLATELDKVAQIANAPFRIKTPFVLTEAYVGALFEPVPEFLFTPMASALDVSPGGHELPAKIAVMVSQVPHDPAARVRVRSGLKAVKTLSKFAVDLLPRDLKAVITLAANGAGLTLTGHPAGWFFLGVGTVCDLGDIAVGHIDDMAKIEGRA